jgi:hypothetical protein
MPFTFPFIFRYDVIAQIGEGTHLIAGDRFTLLLVTRANLTNQGLTSSVDLIFAALDDAVRGLTIVIGYEDVFGNKQEDYRVTCDRAHFNLRSRSPRIRMGANNATSNRTKIMKLSCPYVHQLEVDALHRAPAIIPATGPHARNRETNSSANSACLKFLVPYPH